MTLMIAGYELDADRLYDPDTHMWVQLGDDGHARVGLDPLGRETSGDIVALSLAEPGRVVRRGESLGDLEAAKFVGPLVSPISGTVVAVNDEVLGDPGLLNADPATHWLVALAPDTGMSDELGALLQGAEQLEPWFAAEVDRFRRQGAIAE